MKKTALYFFSFIAINVFSQAAQADIIYNTVTHSSLIDKVPQLNVVWPPAPGTIPGINPAGSTAFSYSDFGSPFINFRVEQFATTVPNSSGESQFTGFSSDFDGGISQTLAASGPNYINITDPHNFNYGITVDTVDGGGTPLGTFSFTGIGFSLFNTAGYDDPSVFAGVSLPNLGPDSIQDQFEYLLTIVDPAWTHLAIAIADDANDYANQIVMAASFTTDPDILPATVPIPATAYLLAPCLIGLLGFNRKSSV